MTILGSLQAVSLQPLLAQSTDPISFAVVGNLGEDNSNHTAVANMVETWAPDFVLSLGNNRNLGYSYDTVIGKRYCSHLPHSSAGENCTPDEDAETAFFPTLGPQDYLAENGIDAYLDYFDLPNNERYYDFVRGPVHFFALNSNTNESHGNSQMSAQASWLRERLQESTSRWQVVYFHHAPYTSGKKGDYAPMQWPFSAWGVDVVLSGNDRHYERIVRDGVLYYVNGLAESVGRLNSPVEGSQARFRKHFGAMRVTADEQRLVLEFHSISGYSDLVQLTWTANRRKPTNFPLAGSAAANLALEASRSSGYELESTGAQANLNCLQQPESCPRDFQPDCVDGGTICLHHEQPGPYHRYANKVWESGREARYGQLTYVKIDKRRGATVDNLLAGYPNRPKIFCGRPANHLKMGEPANGNQFLAWSDFQPSLTEPPDITVVQRNGRHLYWSTVVNYAKQPNPDGRFPIFVLNGSFFTPESAPEGSQWRNGQMQRIDPNRSMIAFSQDGRRAEILWGDGAPLQLGRYKPIKTVICAPNQNGEMVEVPQPAPGVDLSWIHTAIGGGPVFMLPDANDLDARGEPRIKVAFPGTTRVTTTTVPFNPVGENFGQESSPYRDQDAFEHRFYVYFAKDNPKTFVCVGESVILLGIAQEISGLELGNRLIELGCHTAMGLDDNSATGFAWRQNIAVSPAKKDVFRYIPNAIGVFAQERWWGDE